MLEYVTCTSFLTQQRISTEIYYAAFYMTENADKL